MERIENMKSSSCDFDYAQSQVLTCDYPQHLCFIALRFI